MERGFWFMLNSYEDQIKAYIAQNLDMALLARYSEDTYNRINKERENLELYRNMVLNSELKEKIIAKITEYVISKLQTSFKAELPESSRESYYMNSVKAFLDSHQMVLLAKKFSQEIQNGRIR